LAFYQSQGKEFYLPSSSKRYKYRKLFIVEHKLENKTVRDEQILTLAREKRKRRWLSSLNIFVKDFLGD